MQNKRVYIVDDDAQLRSALEFLFWTHQINVTLYKNGLEFLESVDDLAPGCVLLDVRMPKLSGIDTLERLGAHQDKFAIIVMTGHGDIDTAVMAMKLGAVDFVEKPFEEDKLVQAVTEAYDAIIERRLKNKTRFAALDRIKKLTPRETQVLQLLMSGVGNKGAAQRLGVSPRTVEMHRSNMISRLEANGLSDAVRIACIAGLPPAVK